MRLPPFDYLAPRTTREALEMMGRYKGKVRIVAGGTDIINRLRQRLLTPAYVMSLKGVAGFAGIRRKKTEIVISAGTTLREIAESPDMLALAGSVARSAGLVAAPPIQNIATIGGNLLQNTRCLFYNQSELVRSAAPPCLKQGGTALRRGERQQALLQCLPGGHGAVAHRLRRKSRAAEGRREKNSARA